MSKFIKSLAVFFAGLPLVVARSQEGISLSSSSQAVDDTKAVSLRPLNREIDNLFASHRSHSSHRSHASHSSHYSGSGGYVAPSPAPSPYARVPAAPYVPANPSSTNSSSINPVVAPTATPDVDHSVSLSSELNAQPAVIKTQESRDEKLRIQVIRVQIRLNTLGLYNDKIDGVFGSTTKNALRIFQRVREIPATGLMTTDTLNALGIPAVN